MNRSAAAGERIAFFGRYFAFFALALVLIWVGGLKFAAYEAQAVQSLASESPLLSWVYDIVGVRSFARLLGSAEILAGVAILLRPALPWASAIGGAFATVLFAVTASFLFTTPGVYEAAGFPQLSPMPGQFLAKDLLLLAAAVWVVGDSLAATGGHRRTHARDGAGVG